MADIEFSFEDNSVKINKMIDDAIGNFLIEASAEIVSQTARNTRVKTGQLKGSWQANVDEKEGVATIGSPLENSIWEEFGTGVYALNGDGRKTAWRYQDANGNWHTTTGKKGTRAFYNAFISKKPSIIRRAEEIFKAKFGD